MAFAELDDDEVMNMNMRVSGRHQYADPENDVIQQHSKIELPTGLRSRSNINFSNNKNNSNNNDENNSSVARKPVLGSVARKLPIRGALSSAQQKPTTISSPSSSFSSPGGDDDYTQKRNGEISSSKKENNSFSINNNTNIMNNVNQMNFENNKKPSLFSSSLSSNANPKVTFALAEESSSSVVVPSIVSEVDDSITFSPRDNNNNNKSSSVTSALASLSNNNENTNIVVAPSTSTTVNPSATADILARLNPILAPNYGPAASVVPQNNFYNNNNNNNNNFSSPQPHQEIKQQQSSSLTRGRQGSSSGASASGSVTPGLPVADFTRTQKLSSQSPNFDDFEENASPPRVPPGLTPPSSSSSSGDGGNSSSVLRKPPSLSPQRNFNNNTNVTSIRGVSLSPNGGLSSISNLNLRSQPITATNNNNEFEIDDEVDSPVGFSINSLVPTTQNEQEMKSPSAASGNNNNDDFEPEEKNSSYQHSSGIIFSPVGRDKVPLRFGYALSSEDVADEEHEKKRKQEIQEEYDQKYVQPPSAREVEFQRKLLEGPLNVTVDLLGINNKTKNNNHQEEQHIVGKRPSPGKKHSESSTTTNLDLIQNNLNQRGNDDDELRSFVKNLKDENGNQVRQLSSSPDRNAFLKDLELPPASNSGFTPSSAKKQNNINNNNFVTQLLNSPLPKSTENSPENNNNSSTYGSNILSKVAVHPMIIPSADFEFQPDSTPGTRQMQKWQIDRSPQALPQGLNISMGRTPNNNNSNNNNTKSGSISPRFASANSTNVSPSSRQQQHDHEKYSSFPNLPNQSVGREQRNNNNNNNTTSSNRFSPPNALAASAAANRGFLNNSNSTPSKNSLAREIDISQQEMDEFAPSSASASSKQQQQNNNNNNNNNGKMKLSEAYRLERAKHHTVVEVEDKIDVAEIIDAGVNSIIKNTNSGIVTSPNPIRPSSSVSKYHDDEEDKYFFTSSEERQRHSPSQSSASKKKNMLMNMRASSEGGCSAVSVDSGIAAANASLALQEETAQHDAAVDTQSAVAVVGAVESYSTTWTLKKVLLVVSVALGTIVITVLAVLGFEKGF